MKHRLVKINDDFCLLSKDEIKIGDVAFTITWNVTPVIDESYLEKIKENPKEFRKIVASTAGIGAPLNKIEINKLLENFYIEELGEIAYKRFENEYNFDKIEKEKKRIHNIEIIEFSHIDEYIKIKSRNLALDIEVDDKFNIIR